MRYQARVLAAAELGIYARIAGIARQNVRDALRKHRTLVRTSANRDTKHILPADELPLWMAAMRAAVSPGTLRGRSLLRSYAAPPVYYTYLGEDCREWPEGSGAASMQTRTGVLYHSPHCPRTFFKHYPDSCLNSSSTYRLA